MGLEPPPWTPLPQEIQAVDDASGECWEWRAGWHCWSFLLLSLWAAGQNSSPWGVLLRAGIQSGMNPLQSKQCVWTRTDISWPHLAQPLHFLLFWAESPFCHHRLQEIRKIKLAIGPPGSPGQPGEPGVRLSTQQELLAPYSYSEYWSHFLLPLLPFSIFGDCFRERRTNDLRLQKYLKVSRRFLYCLKPSDWDWSCPCIYSLGCPFTHHLLFTVPLGFFSLALDDMKHRTEELIHVKTFFPPLFSSFVLTLFWWLLCSVTIIQTTCATKRKGWSRKDEAVIS